MTKREIKKLQKGEKIWINMYHFAHPQEPIQATFIGIVKNGRPGCVVHFQYIYNKIIIDDCTRPIRVFKTYIKAKYYRLKERTTEASDGIKNTEKEINNNNRILKKLGKRSQDYQNELNEVYSKIDYFSKDKGLWDVPDPKIKSSRK